MYGTSQRENLKENSNFSVGISENVTINAEFRSPKKDGTGDSVLCIDILGKNNEKLTVTEWNGGDDEKKITNQLTRLRRWVKEVIGEDSFPTQFSSYEEMCKTFCSTVNGKNTPLEIKLVYNDKGYLEMPKYDGCVRAMSNPVRLKLSQSEMARTTKKVIEPTPMDELGTAGDELPF